MSQPWMKFYPSDWRADPALRMCSLAARGLWMEMLCVMHEAEGFLTVNGKQLLPRQLAGLAGATIEDVTNWLVELSDAGVFSRDEHGTIFSRRMRKDIARAQEDKANGRKGGNPTLKGGVNPPVGGGDKAQKPEARYQIPEAESKEGKSASEDASPSHRATGEIIPLRLKAKDPPPDRGTRLPPNWQPPTELHEFARNEGFTDDQFRREISKFRDYWLSASGGSSVKRDWVATCRNWLRKAADGFNGPVRVAANGHGPPIGGIAGAYQRAASRFRNPDDVPE